MGREAKNEKDVKRDYPKKNNAKAKVEVVKDDDFLKEAKKQADNERAAEGELLVRMGEKNPEKCHCGCLFRTPVSDQGTCGVCPHCVFAVKLKDSRHDALQSKELEGDVLWTLSVWASG